MRDPFIVAVNPANTEIIERAVQVAKLAGAVESDDVILGDILAAGALYMLRISRQLGSPLQVVR